MGTACRYSCEEELLDDLRLMFSNCRQYNEEASVIYEDANALEKVLFDKARELGLGSAVSAKNKRYSIAIVELSLLFVFSWQINETVFVCVCCFEQEESRADPDAKVQGALRGHQGLPRPQRSPAGHHFHETALQTGENRAPIKERSPFVLSWMTVARSLMIFPNGSSRNIRTTTK